MPRSNPANSAVPAIRSCLPNGTTAARIESSMTPRRGPLSASTRHSGAVHKLLHSRHPCISEVTPDTQRQLRQCE
jgi:hypothetical protein